ncbi:MAG: toprim domain-containing protein, partial [Thermodesulfobacteriota bacterium]
CRESDSIFIVEGYMDVLAMHQAGFQNAVATLGTGLTEDHIRILKGFCRRFYLLYDSDDAGIKATEKIVGILARENVEARVVTLPPGFDPDSFLRERSPEEFKTQVGRSRGVMDFLIESAIAKHDLSVDGKIRILSELETPLSSIDDGMQRSLFTRVLSERLDINESFLLEKIRSLKKENRSGRGLIGKAREPGIDARFLSGESGIRLEQKLVAMMLQFPAMIPRVEEERIVDFFTDPILKSIARKILDYNGDPADIVSELITSIDDDLQESMIAQLALDEEEWSEPGCMKLISQFQRRLLHRQHKPLINRIKAAEDSNNESLLEELLKERQSQSGKKESSSL